MTRPPDINRTVLVYAGDAETALYSRVESSSPGQLSIAYPSDGQTAYELPVDSTLRLEWLVSRGLASVEAVVVGHDLLRVPTLTLDLVEKVVVHQRRDHARADLVLDIEVWQYQDTEQPLTGVTLDVSGGGARAVLDGPLKPDSYVRFSLDLPDGSPLGGIARVVDQREDCVALEFQDILPRDRERLVRAVFASHSRDASIVRRPLA